MSTLDALENGPFPAIIAAIWALARTGAGAHRHGFDQRRYLRQRRGFARQVQLIAEAAGITVSPKHPPDERPGHGNTRPTIAATAHRLFGSGAPWNERQIRCLA